MSTTCFICIFGSSVFTRQNMAVWILDSSTRRPKLHSRSSFLRNEIKINGMPRVRNISVFSSHGHAQKEYVHRFRPRMYFVRARVFKTFAVPLCACTRRQHNQPQRRRQQQRPTKNRSLDHDLRPPLTHSPGCGQRTLPTDMRHSVVVANTYNRIWSNSSFHSNTNIHENNRLHGTQTNRCRHLQPTAQHN